MPVLGVACRLRCYGVGMAKARAARRSAGRVSAAAKCTREKRPRELRRPPESSGAAESGRQPAWPVTPSSPAVAGRWRAQQRSGEMQQIGRGAWPAPLGVAGWLGAAHACAAWCVDRGRTLPLAPFLTASRSTASSMPWWRACGGWVRFRYEAGEHSNGCLRAAQWGLLRRHTRTDGHLAASAKARVHTQTCVDVNARM